MNDRRNARANEPQQDQMSRREAFYRTSMATGALAMLMASGQFGEARSPHQGELSMAASLGPVPFSGWPGLFKSLAHRLAGDESSLPDEGPLASFGGATDWLNSDALTPDGLRGRVVLVDFWTYTCVNWLRTLPYVRAWADRYADAGLTVVGVHTPEFGFERDRDNVVAATRMLDVRYPVARDNDYAVWQAFANHYWPAVYLADAEGRIRYHHYGEGEYAMTEMAIQQLLIEGGAKDIDASLVTVEPQGLEVAADWSQVRSGESYTGYGQSSGFAQGDIASYDEPADYALPERLSLNDWALAGNWTVTKTSAVANQPGGRLAFEFHARDLNLVMGPTDRGLSIPFQVLLDGEPVGEAYGSDVQPDGRGVVDAQRTYQLIRQPAPIADRRFEIAFDAAGADLYCFTFG